MLSSRLMISLTTTIVYTSYYGGITMTHIIAGSIGKFQRIFYIVDWTNSSSKPTQWSGCLTDHIFQICEIEGREGYHPCVQDLVYDMMMVGSRSDQIKRSFSCILSSSTMSNVKCKSEPHITIAIKLRFPLVGLRVEGSDIIYNKSQRKGRRTYLLA